MKMHSKGLHRLLICFSLCLCAAWVTAQVACSPQTDTGDNSSGDDDGDDDDDNDDSSGDGDAELCEDYPDADEDFDKGSVISNYLLLDKDDKETEICELAEGAKMMLIKLTCMT